MYGDKSKFSGATGELARQRKKEVFEAKTYGRYGSTGIDPRMHASLMKERDRFFTVA